jgi:hypothetical protein
VRVAGLALLSQKGARALALAPRVLIRSAYVCCLVLNLHKKVQGQGVAKGPRAVLIHATVEATRKIRVLGMLIQYLYLPLPHYQ